MPDDASGRRIGLDAALEVDVVAFDDGVRIQVAAELQFRRRSDCNTVEKQSRLSAIGFFPRTMGYRARDP